MIGSEKIYSYVSSLLDLEKNGTDGLYKFLSDNDYPVVKKDVARFLSQIVMLKQPGKILELGTNEGFSAIVMAKEMKKGKIFTIDYREDLHAKAAKNFEKYAVSEKIELITARTEDVLPGLNEDFDLIFIDADKRSYPFYLEYAVSHTASGGIIIADNLFWKGSVISPESFENKKTAVPTLRQFNKNFSTLTGFNSQVLSIGDGLGFAVRRD